MAIDTIGLASLPIDEDIVQRLEQECTLRQGVRLSSGEVLYEITTGELKGSYDHRICFRIERSRWQAVHKAPPVRVPCAPYIYIEGSVHKAILGHNVYGGPVSFRAAAWWLIDSMTNLFQVELPVASFWEVRRIDVAEVYEFPSFEAISEYFRGLKAVDYPRRRVGFWDLTGLYWSGRTTTVKFYHKGPEFNKHDRPRLKKLFTLSELNELQIHANRLFRAEVEVKPEKLSYDFGQPPLVREVVDGYLYGIFDQEVDRVLKEGDSKVVDKVREARAVQQRLHELYGSRMANTLFGVWVQLATLGPKALRTSMTRSTYYKYCGMLKDAGCSWDATDLVLKEHSLVPSGFSLRRGSPWHLSAEHPVITQQLDRYRAS